jgi:Replication protein
MPTLARLAPMAIPDDWETPAPPEVPPTSLDAAGNKRRSADVQAVPQQDAAPKFMRALPDPFAACRRSRARIIEALATHATEPEERNLCRRLHLCCEGPRFAVDGHGLPYLCVPKCRSKVCPLCQRTRALKMSRRVAEILESMNAPRMITLTIVSCDRPLRERLRHLAESFRRLRQQDRWSECVAGGLYIVEVTRNHKTGQWHPHIHLIVTGRFYPHAQLKAGWKQATGDSEIVHLNAVHDRFQASRYLSKYVAKSADFEHWPTAAVFDFVTQTRGVRMCGTFGCLRNVPLIADEDPPAERGYNELCTVQTLRHWAQAGRSEATEAVELLQRLAPQWARRCGFDAPEAPRDLPAAEDWERLTRLLAALPAHLFSTSDTSTSTNTVNASTTAGMPEDGP